MKKILLICLVVMLAITSCDNSPKGNTWVDLENVDSNLPDELKGLKIYTVKISEFEYVKVAIIENEINGVNYNVGKTKEDVIIVKNKVIEYESIISENDSIIVLRK